MSGWEEHSLSCYKEKGTIHSSSHVLCVIGKVKKELFFNCHRERVNTHVLVFCKYIKGEELVQEQSLKRGLEMDF